jgi:sugar phosphate isomerase/epimerase
MELGIFARTFARPSLHEALDAVVASGIGTIQLNMSQTSGEPAERVRDEIAARGLAIAAVSGTYNMAHPDPAVRAEGGEGLAALIAAVPRLGTRVVTLCTGSRAADDMWRAHPGNATREAWNDSVEQIAAALAVADEHDVVLAFEPEHGNVVAGARAARRLLDELRSPRLQVVLDAANLIRPGELDRQGDTLREAFALLGDDLALAHAKDVRADGTIVPAGLGGLDYELYVDLLGQARYDGPLVLHGLPEERVPASAGYVREHLARGAV